MRSRPCIQGRYSRAGDALGRGLHPTGITGSNASGLCLDSAVTGGTYGAPCLPDQVGDRVTGLDSYVGLGGKKPIPQLNRAEYAVGGNTTIAGPDAAVPNNAALKNVQGNVSKHLMRLGFRAPGDGGAATYNWSAGNCTAPDDGAQIQPSSGTGCWIADFSAVRPVPEVWGAVGDGATNDAAAINAALTYLASGGGKLYARAGSKYGVTATIDLKPDVCLVGAGIDKSQIILLDAAVAPVINMGSRACLEDIHIAAGLQASGTVIQMGASGAATRSVLRRVYTDGGCVAVDVNGVSQVIDRSFFYHMKSAAGCGGIRAGHNTLGAGTVDLRITNSTTACNFVNGNAADFNMRLEDAGGTFIGPGIDNIGCRNGLVIKPGAGQEVAFTFCNAAAIADTNIDEGLLIDTGHSSAVVRGNSFDQCWTSASRNKSGIRIQNTGGGTITGTVFMGHRAYLNFANGIELVTPVSGTITDIFFDGLRVCGTQRGAVFLVGNNLAATIQNSRLGKQCDGQIAGNTTGLRYGIGLGSNTVIVATGNDLSYTGPQPWSPFSGIPTGDSIVANNKGVDTGSGPTYASGSTVTLNVIAPRIHLTGTTTVNTIMPAWNGQQLCIISDSGALNFGTRGNIAAAVSTSGAGGVVCGWYDGSFLKWRFR